MKRSRKIGRSSRLMSSEVRSTKVDKTENLDKISHAPPLTTPFPPTRWLPPRFCRLQPDTATPFHTFQRRVMRRRRQPRRLSRPVGVRHHHQTLPPPRGPDGACHQPDARAARYSSGILYDINYRGTASNSTTHEILNAIPPQLSARSLASPHVRSHQAVMTSYTSLRTSDSG